MSPNPRIEADDVDRLEGAVAQPTRHEPEAREWPDDGLPARFASTHPKRTLHPLGVVGTLLGRS